MPGCIGFDSEAAAVSENITHTTDDPGSAKADGPTILVAMANPRTERALLRLGSVLAAHQDGEVLAAHIVTVPDEVTLETVHEYRDQLEKSSQKLLDRAVDAVDTRGVPVETETLLSLWGLKAVFDAAEAYDVETVVMGYSATQFTGSRAEGTLDELAQNLPCDFLILDGEELDVTDVLVPTGGGASSDLSAEVARILQIELDAHVTLLYVVDPGEEAAGREFLSDWAEMHDLADATLRVEVGDVERVITGAAGAFSLLVVGATERGLLTRIVQGSLTFKTLSDVETPVLLAERQSTRSLWERLFGQSKPKPIQQGEDD